MSQGGLRERVVKGKGLYDPSRLINDLKHPTEPFCHGRWILGAKLLDGVERMTHSSMNVGGQSANFVTDHVLTIGGMEIEAGMHRIEAALCRGFALSHE